MILSNQIKQGTFLTVCPLLGCWISENQVLQVSYVKGDQLLQEHFLLSIAFIIDPNKRLAFLCLFEFVHLKILNPLNYRDIFRDTRQVFISKMYNNDQRRYLLFTTLAFWNTRDLQLDVSIVLDTLIKKTSFLWHESSLTGFHWRGKI